MSLRKSSNTHTHTHTHLLGAGGAVAKKVLFPFLFYRLSWESKMKHVITYYLYSDILLMVSIYVTTSVFLFQGKPNNGPTQEMWIN